MGGKAGVPIQRVTLDKGNESAVSKQQVDASRMSRSATNAGRLRTYIYPLRGNKGVQAVKLFKLHVEIPTNEAGNPPG